VVVTKHVATTPTKEPAMTAAADAIANPTSRAPAVERFMAMSGAELDEVFASADATVAPTGRGRGTALAMTGTTRGRRFTSAVRATSWKGKRFADDGASLRNLVGPIGATVIAANVYVGESRVDGRPCVVLDYSRTSWIARWVRDEIREVEPGVYLGIVFMRSRRLPLRFLLEF
jgi:hypothetical protein